MALAPNGFIGRFLHRRSLARWQRAAAASSTTNLAALAVQYQMAQQLQRPLSTLAVNAQSRLSLPRAGSTHFPRPVGTDWSWRPEAWRVALPVPGIAPALPKTALREELRVFHDCPLARISLRQTRNARDTDLAPYGLTLEVMQFSGTYLSVVIEVPPASCHGLRRRHLIRLATVVEYEAPAKIHARLNVKHGPNTEQILLALPDDRAETMVEFDLAYGQIDEARAERMWIDLMIDKPAMNMITFRDLTLSRYPRAEI